MKREALLSHLQKHGCQLEREGSSQNPSAKDSVVLFQKVHDAPSEFETSLELGIWNLEFRPTHQPLEP